MEANDETGPAGFGIRELPLRLGLALLVTLAQALASVAVAVLWWLPSLIGTDWLGLEYFIIGALVAVTAGAAFGSLTAAKLRLPLYLLYCLPAPLLAAAQWIEFDSSILPWEPYGLLIIIGGNLLIALATAGRPRRPASGEVPVQPAPSS